MRLPAVRRHQRHEIRAAHRGGAHVGRVGRHPQVARPPGKPPRAKLAGRLRPRATLVVVAIAAFAVGILVAILGGGLPATRQPNGGEWLVQAALLVAITLLLVVRLRRKG